MMPSAALPYPRVDPHDVRATAARLRQLAERAGDATDTLRVRSDSLGATWEGPAANACSTELVAVGQLTSSVASPLRSAATVLLAFAESVTVARRRIDQLRLDYAEMVCRHRLQLDRVLTQAAVAPVARDALREVLLSEQRLELAACSRRHEQVLEELRMLARAYGGRLAALALDALPVGSAAGQRPTDLEPALASALPMLFAQRSMFSQTLGWPPPAKTDARLVRAAWGGLATDEQQRLLAAHPESLGQLGGLPAAVRSSANEMVVDQVIRNLSNRSGLNALDRRSLLNAQLVRRRLDDVRANKDPVTGEPVVAQLLTFDPRAYAGDGLAALSIGDLDTADNVAFLVPGTNSKISSSWHGLTTNAHRVMDLSRRRDPARTTAVVAWMGYDAPKPGSAVDDDAARQGGSMLLRDVRALAAVRDVPPRVTLVGHSYGSTTVGEALQRRPPGVHDAVAIGSPGLGVEHVSELNLSGHHVFVGASSRDWVTYVDLFGKDPSHESFGAVRFQAEDPTRYRFGLSQADHSKYYWADSESLSNIVDVVIGRYDDVERAAYRLEPPVLVDVWLGDPESYRTPTTPERN